MSLGYIFRFFSVALWVGLVLAVGGLVAPHATYAATWSQHLVCARKIIGFVLIVSLFLLGSAQAKDGQTPLLLNSQPYFPVGVAGAPIDLLRNTSDGQLDFSWMFTELKNAGMNTFLAVFLTSEEYNISHPAVHDFASYQCQARQADSKSGIGALRQSGLAVLLPAWTEVEEPDKILLNQPIDETVAATQLQTLNACYQGIPILGYQTYDDAPIYGDVGVPLQKMWQFNRLAKQYSSATNPYVFAVHPTIDEVSVNTGNSTPWLVDLLNANLPSYSTSQVADNIGLYRYPIPGRPAADVGKAIDGLRNSSSSPLRPLVVLQGFGWHDLTASSTERRPTAQETYFMAVQAIVHGAGGVMWWGANFIESSSELWEAIKLSSGVINAISPWLVQPDSTISVQAPGVETLLKTPLASYSLLLVVNPSPTPVRTRITLAAPKPYTIVENLGWGQPPVVTKGSFTHTLEGYGVRFFSVRFSDTPQAQ